MGRSEVPVLVSPARAAECLEEHLEALALRPAVVWSSRATRCAEPARRLALRLGIRHATSERVAELDYGRFEGRSWAAIETHDGAALARWMEAWTERAPPGGESVAELEARVARFWHALPPAESALLVAHAGVVRALRVLRGGLSWREALRRPVPHLEPELFD